jgi:hypothetical protein
MDTKINTTDYDYAFFSTILEDEAGLFLERAKEDLCTECKDTLLESSRDCEAMSLYYASKVVRETKMNRDNLADWNCTLQNLLEDQVGIKGMIEEQNPEDEEAIDYYQFKADTISEIIESLEIN